MVFSETNHSVLYILTIFGVFITNHSVESSLHQNKMTWYFGLWSNALASKKRNNNKMEEQKFKITSEVLKEVTIEFPQFKEFIEQRLEQEYLKENISVEEVIFLFTRLEVKSWRKKTFFIL